MRIAVIGARRGLPALATFASVIGASIWYLSVTPNLYETSARLIVEDKRMSVSPLNKDFTQVSSNTRLGASSLADQAELVKSQPVLRMAIASVFPESEKSPDKPTTASLRQNLKVQIIPDTNILELTYQTKNRDLAAKLLNAVSQAMVEENTKAMNSEVTEIQEFLAKEMPSVRQRLQLAESAENKYRQKSGIVSFTDQSKSLVDSLASLENQERTLLAQLQEALQRDASLRQITNTKTLSGGYASVRSGQDEQIKKLRTKLADLEGQVIQLRLRFTSNHPAVIKLIEEQDAIRALYTAQLARVSTNKTAIAPSGIASDQLSQNLRSKLISNEIERLAVQKKLKTVQELRAKLKTRLAELPIKQQPLTALTRKREEAVTSLKLLQTKLEEARIAEAQKVSNIRIIEPAKPPTLPSSPQPLVVLLLASVLGIILTVCVILLLEVMDNTLHDGSEAEDLLKLPLLGVLPRLSAKSLSLKPAQAFFDDVRAFEPYRTLFKTLEFRGCDQSGVIVISSTLSGEGKSVVVSHLAAVSALLSRRTLIIDADLGRPMQHKFFNLPPESGITEVITGNKSLGEAVQPTDIENLSVLSCAELHKRSSYLLESAGMKTLLLEAAAQYDMVIIDTPPLCASADAATLTQYTDGMILVTRPSFTVKEILQRTVSELIRNKIPIVGIVVNGMTTGTKNYQRHPIEGQKPLSDSLKRLTGLVVSTKNSFNGSRSK